MVSTSRLAESDPGLLRAGLAAFAGLAPADDELADIRTWVLNRPYEGASLRTSGRVLAEDGQEGYREVPGEPSAVTALRAAYPDEALAAVLETDVDDPWSPAADEVLDRCSALAEAGADGVRLEGQPGRRADPSPDQAVHSGRRPRRPHRRSRRRDRGRPRRSRRDGRLTSREITKARGTRT
jgi:hypothetical protein